MNNKRQYKKPVLEVHGKVEELTNYHDHDVFGGGFLSPACKARARQTGPADFGS
jgi:hypothetical protein